jgi:hypothetical protein
MSLDLIDLWHKRARPTPDAKGLGVSLGCHAEEFVEMLDSLEHTQAVWDARRAVTVLANLWKSGEHYPVIADRKELLDSLADQIVTAVGVGHCANMNVPEACLRVNQSNWSKTVEGKFVYDANGKIAKPSTYQPPNLEGLW